MKNYNNCKIEIDYENHLDGKYRWFFWRIDPKELSILEKIFKKNRWRTFKNEVLGDLSPYYSIKDYNDTIKNIVTYEDAVNYQNKENEKARKEHERLVQEGLTWGF